VLFQGGVEHNSDMDPRLAQIASVLSVGEGRVCFLLDAEYRLAWVSEELRGFIGVHDDASLGIGQHIIKALLSPAWESAVTAESGRRLMHEITLPYLRAAELASDVRECLPPDVLEMFSTVEPAPSPVRTGRIDYLQPGLPPYPIDFVSTSLRDETGQLIGTMVLMYLRLRPGLVALLGRGDAAMYERMARLVQPERRAATILFADLQASAELSRMLPTAAYFNLIRELTVSFDSLIAEHGGIVGKHAGDGWTAFLLAHDAAGPSGAVAGCIEIARQLQVRAADQSSSSDLATELDLRINCGVHWGPSVYLGQLVPGGRLEVTALGDEVNECARIQQCARDGAILASKQALELLDASDARQLGIDPSRLTYRHLTGMTYATDKTRRDAGTIVVARVDRL
jgi:class 3 adenylate cyclase